MPRFTTRRVRVLRALRSAQLERAHALLPADIAYDRTRYDFDPAAGAGLALHECGTLALALGLLRGRVDDLEVTEPLARRGIWRACVAVAAVRLRAAVTGTRVTVGSYAIENLDPYFPPDGPRAALRHRLDLAGSRWLHRRLDRLAFGTDAAAELGRRLLGPARQERVVPALPAPCRCLSTVAGAAPGDAMPKDAPEGAEADRGTADVLFLGGLIDRKGVEQLVRAWPEVLARRPGTGLTVIGKGPLEAAVRALAAAMRADGRAGVEVIVDPPRARIHAELRRHTILVLPSQPMPRYWREQVGLPIVEALAHGLTVITTSQTGLASWLAEHGHRVYDDAASVPELVSALVRALDAPLARAEVLATLPTVDGRIAADHWLFGPPADRSEDAGPRAEFAPAVAGPVERTS